ncbi:MAG: ATP-dependent helicase [Verrucomicrobiota bacterium]
MSRSYALQPPAHSGTGIDFAAELNAEQLAAVTSPPGASLVIAGAGSGKTRTLTYRVAWLLEQGIPPHSILLLTFTNKASREMIERVQNLLPGRAEGLWSGTFHSIGNRILRRHAEAAGFREGFSIMDREDAEDMIAAVVAKEGVVDTTRKFPKASVLADIFSYSINTASPISRVLAEKYRYFLPLAPDIEKVQSAYEARKRESNSLDFDDLLSKTLALFETRPDIAENYQRRFQHILVDEYQDTNRLQSELIDRFAAHHGNVMVVGDDAQSIYSWRGANFENILHFPKTRPGARVFKIETNYRSVPQVLDLANAAILGNEKQFPKNLAPVREQHPVKPALVALPTNSQQAAFIAQRVMELLDEGVPLEQMAVLYRAHYHSMEVQLEFTKRGIPFSITSGLRFFEQAHIKDVAAFLKFTANPRDEMSFKRIVRLLPGIGNKTADTLWDRVQTLLAGSTAFDRLAQIKVPAKAEKDWAQLAHTLSDLAPDGKPLAPSAMIECVLFGVYEDYMKTKFPNYEARRDDLQTLKSFATQFESTSDFLSQLALLGGLETADAFAGAAETEKITLSTLHQAKGLEWRVVFLVWLADGMFPSSRCIDDPASLEEERRLFYVGITRCMDELYLTYPEMRLGAGYGETFQTPSRFLREIPEDLMEIWDVNPSPYGKSSAGSVAIDDEPF